MGVTSEDLHPTCEDKHRRDVQGPQDEISGADLVLCPSCSGCIECTRD